MDSKPTKVIKDVFICSAGNNLQLVDIYVNSKIVEIKAKFREKINFGEIRDKSSLNSLKEVVERKKYSGDLQVIDGRFRYAMPGAVDSNVYFYNKVDDGSDNFLSGSLAAAAGGVTTVVDMPGYSVPHVSSLDSFRLKLTELKGNSYIDYSCWAALENWNLESSETKKQIRAIANDGAAGFVVFPYAVKNMIDKVELNNLHYLADCIRPTGLPLAIQPEKGESVEFNRYRAERLRKNDFISFTKVFSHQTELEGVTEIIKIAAEVKGRYLLLNLCTANAYELVRKLRWREVDITIETTPHHLAFNSDVYNDSEIAKKLKTFSPVKWESDREALWKGVKNGDITFVNSSHYGNSAIYNANDNCFWDCFYGYPGVETRLPFLLTEGFYNRSLSLEDINNIVALNPAKYFKLKDKGQLKKGKDADIVFVDLWNEQTISGDNLISKVKYTPFEGYKSKAVIDTTLLRGDIISARDKIDFDIKPEGKFIGGNK